MFEHCSHRCWLWLIGLFALQAHALWPFPSTSLSHADALADAGSLGLSADGRVVAFGDFNGDQFLDLLTLGSDGQTVTVHIWDHSTLSFRTSSSFRHPLQVYNVVPGDFNLDGTLDALVMSRGASSRSLSMSLYPGSHKAIFDSDPVAVPSSTLSQPIALDANGDLSIDLLGISYDTQRLQLWKNVWNDSDPNSPLFELKEAPFVGEHCTISNPHSNAVVDLNGDCLADVFFFCDDPDTGGKSYQIWVNEKSQGFTLSRQGSLPSGTISVSFADMDRDGTVDMVFVTCDSVSSSTGVGNDCSVNIAYNQQLLICAHTPDSGYRHGVPVCRPPERLCSADPNFSFDLTDNPTNDAFQKFPISALFPSSANGGTGSGSSLLVLDTSATPAIPLALKLGDINLDGFPDITLVAASVHGGFLGLGSKTIRTPRILYSIPCAKWVVGCDGNGKGRRGWQVVVKGTDPLDAISDARSVTFVDLDEDGSLDLMVQRTGEQGEGTVTFVWNDFFFDAFFLKAIVLNGACNNALCAQPNSTKRYQPFGVSYSGPTFKYTVLDPSGRRSAAQVGQLPQTAYQALLLPYSFFGLGRTNNYIETIVAGSTKQTGQHFANIEGVIPNSKVVVSPPADDDTPWRKELYLRPGSLIPWVMLTLVVTTFLLAIIVLVLRLNEKRQDAREKLRLAHRIDFASL